MKAANKLNALQNELARIADRMRAIPFESPIQYTEFASLRARRAELWEARRALLLTGEIPYSIYGVDVAIAEAC